MSNQMRLFASALFKPLIPEMLDYLVAKILEQDHVVVNVLIFSGLLQCFIIPFYVLYPSELLLAFISTPTLLKACRQSSSFSQKPPSYWPSFFGSHFTSLALESCESLNLPTSSTRTPRTLSIIETISLPSWASDSRRSLNGIFELVELQNS